jgi:hypothetical protein
MDESSTEWPSGENGTNWSRSTWGNSSLDWAPDGAGPPRELFGQYPQELLDFAVAACIAFIMIGVPGNFITILALLRYSKVSSLHFILQLPKPAPGYQSPGSHVRCPLRTIQSSRYLTPTIKSFQILRTPNRAMAKEPESPRVTRVSQKIVMPKIKVGFVLKSTLFVRKSAPKSKSGLRTFKHSD